MDKPPERIKGRGSASNREGRFEALTRQVEDDGWYRDDETGPAPTTQVTVETARSLIQSNDSPDLPFDQTINPYRGCEHGCVYCYARPTHGYINLSAGIDFETKLFAKDNAAEVLRRELGRRGYVPKSINLGASTDAYQPLERKRRLTRQILEVLAEHRHPVTIVTKNALVARDIDLLAPMSRERLAQVCVSVTTLDNTLASRLEPRASAPHQRLRTIGELAAAGVDTAVFVAPIIPMLTDVDLEKILEQARAAGAQGASYTLVRLPFEVKELFREWLSIHLPDRARHVMSLIQQMRDGRDNDPRFGTRMRGTGVFAQLIARRFRVAFERLGYRKPSILDVSRFAVPRAPSAQGELF
jgi:DNA repair photolyase